MTHPYSNSLADSRAAATYPTSVFDPFDVRDKNQDGYSVVAEAFTVPASADADGHRRLYLDLVPLEQSSIAITVDSDPRTLVPLGEAPAAGQVAVSMITGEVRFHSSDAGLTGAATYTGAGTAITSHLLNRIQNELVATQEELDDVVGALGAVAGDDVVPVVRGGTGATSAGDARTALGLAIGTNVQAYSSNLSAIAALGGSVNQVVAVGSTPGAYEYAPLSAFGRTLIDDASASAARTTLGLGTLAVQDAAGITGNLVPAADITSDLGAVSTRWNHVYASEVVAVSGVTTEDLTVAGEVTSDLTMGAGAQIFADGSALVGAPGYAFDTDPDTGMYLVGANTLGLATAAGLRVAIDSARMSVIGIAIGSNSVDGNRPTALYLKATTGAVYSGATKVLGAQQAAIIAPSGGGTQDAEARTAIGSILTALRTHGLIAT